MNTSYNNIKVDWVVGYISENSKSESINRIRDNNELYFCLRSIYKHCSWINKIHIILGQDCKPPVWLKEDPKINLVNESTLYTPIQPNSETKKLFIGKIKNIAEYFITSDDDMFLLKNLKLPNFILNNKPIINSAGYFGKNGLSDGRGHIPLFWKRDDYNYIINKYIDVNYYLNLKMKRVNPFPEIKYHLINRRLAYNGRYIKPDIWIADDCSVRSLTNHFNNIYKSMDKIQYLCINDDYSKYNAQYINEFNVLNMHLNKLFYFDKIPTWEKRCNVHKISVGPSKTNNRNSLIQLNYRIPSNSKIVISQSVSNFNDKFNFKVTNVENNSFNLLTHRLDLDKGWIQDLLINCFIIFE